MAFRSRALASALVISSLPTAAHAIVSIAGDAAAHSFADNISNRSVAGFQFNGPSLVYGSGVLIGSDYVLTAYHAVSGFNASNPVGLTFNFTLGGPTETSNASQIIQVPGSDLAVVKLQTAITDITPAKILQSNTSLINADATGVGYGLPGSGTTGPAGQLTSGAGTNVIDYYGYLATDPTTHVTTAHFTKQTGSAPGDSPSSNPTLNNLIFYDFDNNDPANNALAPGSSDVADANEFALASGDSGGALFATVDGQQQLVGINEGVSSGSNGIASTFGSISYDVRLYPNLAFIDQFVPEPSTAGLTLLAGLPLLIQRRRRTS